MIWEGVQDAVSADKAKGEGRGLCYMGRDALSRARGRKEGSCICSFACGARLVCCILNVMSKGKKGYAI